MKLGVQGREEGGSPGCIQLFILFIVWEIDIVSLCISFFKYKDATGFNIFCIYQHFFIFV